MAGWSALGSLLSLSVCDSATLTKVMLTHACGCSQELGLTTAADLDGGWQLPSGVSTQTASASASTVLDNAQTELQDMRFEKSYLERGSNALQTGADAETQPMQTDALYKGKVPMPAAGGPLDLWAAHRIEIEMDSGTLDEVSSAAAPASSMQRSPNQPATSSDSSSSPAQSSTQDALLSHHNVLSAVKHKEAGQKAISSQHRAGTAKGAAVDFGLADEAFQRAELNIKLNPAAMDADTTAAYSRAAKQHAYNGTIAPALPRQLQAPADPRQKYTYQALMETDELTRFTQMVVNDLRVYFERFHEHTLQRQELEWVIMVDNSGSMSSKRTQTAEALLLAIETLRRLECRFAVWRFGNRGQSGRMPLKQLNEPFTYLTGQKILEGFTYKEGTYPATNFRAIAAQTWGTDWQEPTDLVRKHRIVLMIYDGLTQERHAEDYIQTVQQYHVNLCVLNITDTKEDVVMEEMRKVLHAITFNSYEVVNVSAVNQLPMAMAVIMTRQFDRVLTKTKVCPMP